MPESRCISGSSVGVRTETGGRGGRPIMPRSDRRANSQEPRHTAATRAVTSGLVTACANECVVSAHAHALESMCTRCLDGRWRPPTARQCGAVHPPRGSRDRRRVTWCRMVKVTPWHRYAHPALRNATCVEHCPREVWLAIGARGSQPSRVRRQAVSAPSPRRWSHLPRSRERGAQKRLHRTSPMHVSASADCGMRGQLGSPRCSAFRRGSRGSGRRCRRTGGRTPRV